MRIAYILNTLAMGGTERLVVKLAEGMIARGHTVEIVTLRVAADSDMAASLVANRLGITGNPFTLPRGFLRGIRTFRAFRPDVIHANNFHGNLMARALRAFIPPAAIVSTIHNVFEGGAMRSLALRLTDPLSHHTAAVCETAVETAIHRRVVPRNKCTVIANGIDGTEFAPNAERRIRLRRENGLTSEFVWLASGRLAPAKDLPNLLHAFAQVHAAAPNARLWIAGEGNRRESQRLRALAASLEIGGSIERLGLRRDIPALLDAADGFVLASAWEGMPLALAEAMAMEKSFAATDVGGVRELAGPCGMLVPAGAPDRLAAAMLKQMSLPHELRSAQGKAARQRILQLFSIEQTIQKWESLYKLAVAHRANRS
ncbi:MAG TPA: glycosyltransferase [Terracidiphilus sp.]|jgi:glycosyltransferase involved in cell wall biosynthesis|nr:glycosyltransferase [Terracidiphilus sp.]